jgi:hypothetical protein
MAHALRQGYSAQTRLLYEPTPHLCFSDGDPILLQTYDPKPPPGTFNANLPTKILIHGYAGHAEFNSTAVIRRGINPPGHFLVVRSATKPRSSERASLDAGLLGLLLKLKMEVTFSSELLGCFRTTRQCISGDLTLRTRADHRENPVLFPQIKFGSITVKSNVLFSTRAVFAQSVKSTCRLQSHIRPF